jgi:hypothetical protein
VILTAKPEQLLPKKVSEEGFNCRLSLNGIDTLRVKEKRRGDGMGGEKRVMSVGLIIVF